MCALDFLGHPVAIFPLSGGYPAAISENISDHSMANSAKQVGPPLTYNLIYHYKPYDMGWMKKSDQPTIFRWSDIETTLQ